MLYICLLFQLFCMTAEIYPPEKSRIRRIHALVQDTKLPFHLTCSSTELTTERLLANIHLCWLQVPVRKKPSLRI